MARLQSSASTTTLFEIPLPTWHEVYEIQITMSDLTSFLHAMTSSRTDSELWQLHCKRMETFGFDRLLYGYTRYHTATSLGDPQDWILLTNHPKQYMDVYIKEGHCFNAPMLNWALENNGACSWRWIKDMKNANALSEAELATLKINREMNVTAGYTISFRSVSVRNKGAIGLTAKSGMSQDDVDAVWAEHGEEITVLNNVMHLKLLTLPYSGSRPLTKRQREVLQWVGDGKTTLDIAILLELTPATVEKHLRLARETLEVETTAQAVLKASFYHQMFTLEN